MVDEFLAEQGIGPAEPAPPLPLPEPPPSELKALSEDDDEEDDSATVEAATAALRPRVKCSQLWRSLKTSWSMSLSVISPAAI